MKIWTAAWIALGWMGSGIAASVQSTPPATSPVPQEAAPAERPLEIRVTSRGERVRVKSGETLLGESPAAPGQQVRLRVPKGPVRVELLDPAGAVAASVELAPAEPPAARVGEVQLVHRVYGVFVRLDPGLELKPGEEIVVVREGREVARTRILQVTSGDETYPAGAARLPRGDAPIRKGDEVRRPDK